MAIKTAREQANEENILRKLQIITTKTIEGLKTHYPRNTKISPRVNKKELTSKIRINDSEVNLEYIQQNNRDYLNVEIIKRLTSSRFNFLMRTKIGKSAMVDEIIRFPMDFKEELIPNLVRAIVTKLSGSINQ